MFRYWKVFCFLLLMLLGVWYFFIRDYDYRVSFKTPQATGILYQTLLRWNNWESLQNKVVITKSKMPFTAIEQEFNISDSIIDIKWEILSGSDSINSVYAYLSDRDHSLVQKLKVPFTKTDFVKRSLSTVKRIQKELNELEKKYKVSAIELSEIPKQYCAYVSIESKIEHKANKMIVGNGYILSYLGDQDIKVTGPPFLEVTDWNQETASITFNFCFPVAYSEQYEDFEDIKFKMTEPRPALKTTFNGNYRISDCAWFYILDYAEKHNIVLEKLPTEIFYNDPHLGGNELDWKAEVFLPLKDEK